MDRGGSAQAAVLVGAALILWPAALNGYPLLFVDSTAYFFHTLNGEAPWDKTAAYGPFLLLFHQGVSLWFPLAAQGLILSTLLWWTQRVACGSVTPGRHLALVAGLAAFSSMPWFAATLMPDALTPIVVLGLFLLGFGETRLSRPEMWAAGAIGAVAIASHLSHLPTALALLVLIALVRRSVWPVLRSALPFAAAVAFLLGANAHAFGRMTLSANGAVFLLARLQEDGPALRTLRERCPASGWYLCDFLDRMPMDSDHFLWSPDSPPNRNAAGTPIPMGGARLAPEAQEIVDATLRAYPLDVAWIALGNGLRQLFMARLGDTLDGADLDQFGAQVLARGFAEGERPAWAASRQMQGGLEELGNLFVPLHALVLALSSALLLLAGWRMARRQDEVHRMGLLLCILVGCVGNAFATGALSKPHHRYQARIVWLMPLGAALLARRQLVLPVAEDILIPGAVSAGAA
jgi:hypothetical protein